MVELELRQSTSMNAKILGSGEKSLVLAHGFGLDQSVWDQILPRFVEKCRVLVFDWSFSGAVMNSSLFDSQKYSSYEAFSQDLIALMDELSLRNSIFVGHSMAGMVGCIAAVKRPELFHRLVLLAASPRYLNSQDYQGGFDKSEIESMFAHIESDFQSWASKFAPLVAGVNDPTVVERVRSNLLRMKPGTALSMVKTIFLSDHRDVLKRVEVPSTIIQTQNDLAAPLAVAQFMQRNLKGKVALEVLPVEGHLPQITAPKLLIGVLDEVLDFDSDEPVK